MDRFFISFSNPSPLRHVFTNLNDSSILWTWDFVHLFGDPSTVWTGSYLVNDPSTLWTANRIPRFDGSSTLQRKF